MLYNFEGDNENKEKGPTIFVECRPNYYRKSKKHIEKKQGPNSNMALTEQSGGITIAYINRDNRIQHT